MSFQNLQKLFSDFLCSRSQINGGKSNLMVLDHDGLVNHIAHRWVKEQTRGVFGERITITFL